MPLKQLALSAIMAATGNVGLNLSFVPIPIDQIKNEVRRVRLHPLVEDRAMVHLAQSLLFSDFELVAMAMLVAVESDPNACRLVGAAQAPLAGARPTLGLLATAFQVFGNVEILMTMLFAGKAHNSGCFVIGAEDTPLPERSISIARPILDALGNGTLAPAGIKFLLHANHALPANILAAASRWNAQLVRQAGSGIVIRSNAESEALAAVGLLAQQLGQKAVLVLQDPPPVLAAWLLASKIIPVFYAYGKAGERRIIPDLAPYNGPWLCITSRDGLIETNGTVALNWTLPICNEAARMDLWVSHGLTPDSAQNAARALRIGPSRIAKLAAAASAAVGGMPGKINWPDIEEAVAIEAQSSLAGLAHKVEGRIGGDAFIRPKLIAERLQLLLGRCKLRECLASNLGPATSARYHAGVRALFHGASGTGKSLAAQWLATALGLPIYRVDLASVTSKWIGETEKNIGQLLSAAEEADVVLLFDEADSLFSSRTDVGNANDRHANSQTNYLLQRLENHEGIVILTSNARERLDSAFTRRLDAIIEFPMPDIEARREIWRAHLPQVGLAEGDINHLAAVIDLAGGHIRNLVLSAAVLSDGKAPMISHLLAAAKTEYQKLGRPEPRELEQR